MVPVTIIRGQRPGVIFEKPQCAVLDVSFSGIENEDKFTGDFLDKSLLFHESDPGIFARKMNDCLITESDFMCMRRRIQEHFRGGGSTFFGMDPFIQLSPTLCRGNTSYIFKIVKSHGDEWLNPRTSPLHPSESAYKICVQGKEIG